MGMRVAAVDQASPQLGVYGGAEFHNNDAMQQEQYCTAAVVRRGGGDQPLIVTEGQVDRQLSRWMAGRGHLRAPRRTGSKGRELNSGALAYRMRLQSVPLSLLWRATKNSIGVNLQRSEHGHSSRKSCMRLRRHLGVLPLPRRQQLNPAGSTCGRRQSSQSGSAYLSCGPQASFGFFMKSCERGLEPGSQTIARAGAESLPHDSSYSSPL